ncbi:MAG: SpoIIE family protein phosphatase [Cyanobacteria bacterium P01_F01_bin.143]
MVHILVIDDDSITQVLLKRTLEKQGYKVAIASDGKEGLAKAKQIRPALIICDWIMPQMDGLEVCRQIKAMPELSTTFFILLTALASVENRVQGLNEGADDFLCKPIAMHEITARVRSGLRLHDMSQDLQKQKQLLETELAEAAEYVRSILPQPLQHSGLNIDMRFIPSRELGGDSFDYFWLDSENLAIYLLDVSGHGLRASLPSLSVINLLRSQNLKHTNYYQPSSVLSSLNNMFQMSEQNDKYFTIWYGVYNHKKRKLTYSTAGHPPGILLSKLHSQDVVEQKLKTPGVPVGMFPDAKYVDLSCTIPDFSSLYIFSDGIYEFEPRNGFYWGLDKFINLLKKHQQTPDRDLGRLLQYVRDWHPNFQFDDDLSIMQIDFL